MKAIKISKYECLRCGHKWVPRYERRPGVCPKCKRYDWDKPKGKGTVGRIRAEAG